MGTALNCCSQCQTAVAVLLVMETGRDTSPYRLCVRCWTFKSPRQPEKLVPVADVPASKLRYKGGGHYVPDDDAVR